MIYRVDPVRTNQEAIKRAASALRQKRLIIFPTETVYGLAADAFDRDAVGSVFEAKQRPLTEALPVQIGEKSAVDSVASEVSEAGKRLIEEFFPGPLTLILKKNANVPGIVSADQQNIAVRMPDHKVALEMIWEFGGPIIASSANISGGVEPRTAADAVAQIGDSVEIVLDAGPVRLGVASTVIDVTSSPARLLREGALPVEDIERIIGTVLR